MTLKRSSRPAPVGSTSATDLDEDTLRELTATPEPAEQDAVFNPDEVETRPGNVTDQELYQGEDGLMGAFEPVESIDQLELLEDAGLRSDETSDPELASEEGLAYVAPVDPPVVTSDDPEGLEVAAGFGTSRLDDAFAASQPADLDSGEDEMTARVRDALRADATTSGFADALHIETDGGRVVLRGVVEDLEDDDNAVAVVAEVPGVHEVIDRLDVPGI